MFSQHENQRRSFPELVNKSAQEAAAYITSQGLKPVIIKANSAVTMDYRLDRVRIVVDPTGSVVIRTLTVG